MSKMYEGDIGTVIRIDCGSDVTSATTKEIRITLPTGATTTWSASFSSGLPSSIEHTCIAGDLIAGKYKGQVYIELPAWSGLGETFEFTVYNAFK